MFLWLEIDLAAVRSRIYLTWALGQSTRNLTRLRLSPWRRRLGTSRGSYPAENGLHALTPACRLLFLAMHCLFDSITRPSMNRSLPDLREHIIIISGSRQ